MLYPFYLVQYEGVHILALGCLAGLVALSGSHSLRTHWPRHMLSRRTLNRDDDDEGNSQAERGNYFLPTANNDCTSAPDKKDTKELKLAFMDTEIMKVNISTAIAQNLNIKCEILERKMPSSCIYLQYTVQLMIGYTYTFYLQTN